MSDVRVPALAALRRRTRAPDVRVLSARLGERQVGPTFSPCSGGRRANKSSPYAAVSRLLKKRRDYSRPPALQISGKPIRCDAGPSGTLYLVAFFPLRKMRLLRTGVLPNFGVSDGLMEVATCDTAAHHQQDSPEGPTRDESGYQTRRWVQSVGAVKVGKSLTMAFVSSSLSECVCESSGVRDLGGLKSARRSLIKLGRS